MEKTINDDVLEAVAARDYKKPGLTWEEKFILFGAIMGIIGGICGTLALILRFC